MTKPSTRVYIPVDRLFEIHKDENLGSNNSFSYLGSWCSENCKGTWESDIHKGCCFWSFVELDDALMFKLTWA